MPEDSKHVQSFHCTVWQEAEIHNVVTWYLLEWLTWYWGLATVSCLARAGMVCLTSWGLGAPLDRAVELVPASLEYPDLISSNSTTTISRNIVGALKAVKVMICTFPSYKRHHAGGSEVINDSLGSWPPTSQLLVKLTYSSNFSNLRFKSTKVSWLNWIKIGRIQSIIAWTNPCLQQGMFFHNRNRTTLNKADYDWSVSVVIIYCLETWLWCNITEVL